MAQISNENSFHPLLEMKDWKQHFINGTKGMPKTDPKILGYVEGLLRKAYDGNEEKVNNNGLAPWLVWVVMNIGLRNINTDKLNKLKSVITLFKMNGNVGNVNKYDAQNKTFAMDLEAGAAYAQEKLDKAEKKKAFDAKGTDEEKPKEDIKNPDDNLSPEEKLLRQQAEALKSIPIIEDEKLGLIKRVWAASDNSGRYWVEVLKEEWWEKLCETGDEWAIDSDCQMNNFPVSKYVTYQLIGPPKGKKAPISNIMAVSIYKETASIGEIKQEGNVQPGSQSTSGGWKDADEQFISLLCNCPALQWVSYFGDYYGNLDWDRLQNSLYGGGVGFLHHLAENRPDLLKLLGKARPDILDKNEKIIREIFGNDWVQFINQDINEVAEKNPVEFLRRFDIFLERFGKEAVEVLNKLNLEELVPKNQLVFINKLIPFTTSIPTPRFSKLINLVDLSDFIHNNKLVAHDWFRLLSNAPELKTLLKSVLVKYHDKIIKSYGDGIKGVNAFLEQMDRPRLDNHQDAGKNPDTGEYEGTREVEYKDEKGRDKTRLENFIIPEELKILTKKDRRDFLNASKEYIKSQIKTDEKGKEITFLRLLFGQANPQDVERTLKNEKEEFIEYFDSKFLKNEKKKVIIPVKEKMGKDYWGKDIYREEMKTVEVGYMPGIFEFYIVTHKDQIVKSSGKLTYYPVGIDDAKKYIKSIIKYYYDYHKNKNIDNLKNQQSRATTAALQKQIEMDAKSNEVNLKYEAIADYIQVLIASGENEETAIDFFIKTFHPDNIGVDKKQGYNAYLRTVSKLADKDKAIKVIKSFKDELSALGASGENLYNILISQFDVLSYNVKKGDRVIYNGEKNIPIPYNGGTGRFIHSKNNESEEEKIYTGEIYLTKGEEYIVLGVRDDGETKNGAVLIKDEGYKDVYSETPPTERWFKSGLFNIRRSKVSSVENLTEEEIIRKLVRNRIQMISESKKKTIAYTAILLDNKSKAKLMEFIKAMSKAKKIPLSSNWTMSADHVTINMGPARDKTLLGQLTNIKVLQYASDENVIAVRVIPIINSESYTEIEFEKDKPHITIAFNEQNGARPVMSNKLANWKPVPKAFVISGKITEIPGEI